MIRFVTIFILITVSMVPVYSKPKAYRTIPEIVPLEGFEIGIDASYFSTSSTYDTEGKQYVMPSNMGYSKLDGEITIRYGLSSRLEFRGGVRGRRNHSYVEDVNDLYKSGVESFLFGAKYYFIPKRPWKFGVDLQFRRTFYSNPTSENGLLRDDEIILGDDGMELFAGVSTAYQGKIFRLSLTAGYMRPANDLSDEVPYVVEGGWLFINSTAFILGVKGVYSLSTDQYSNEPSLKPIMNNGNTSLYNGINRSYIAPYVGLSFLAGSVRFGGKFAVYTQGISTDGGTEISFSLSLLSGGKTVEHIKESKFKEYDVEATVIKISPRGVFLKIDKGMSSAIEKGMKIDIYKGDYFGQNILVGYGIVYEVKSDFAIVKLIRKYREKIRIKVGFLARGYEE